MANSEKTCFRAAFIALALFFVSIMISGRSNIDNRDESRYLSKPRGNSPQEMARMRAEWPFMRKQLLSSPDAHKSVFMFCYMRGGKTVLEQLIEEDARAITWHEPLSPIYGYMYALPGFRIPSSIVFDHTPDFKSFRAVGKWEMDHLVYFFTNLYSCKLNNLPPEFLSSYFSGRTSAINDFNACYKKKALYYDKNLQQSKVFHETDCYERTGVGKFCEIPSSVRPQSVGNAILKHCDNFMEYTRALVKLKGSASAVTSDFLSQQIKGATGHSMGPSQSAAFVKQQICMDRLGEIVQECSQTSEIEQQCASKPIRAAKVLRLKMPYMEPIIQAVPDIFVMHYFRDPRAIVETRMRVNGTSFIPFRWEQMTRQLCDEMLTDILAADKLNRTYPGVIQRVRYEDLILDPKDGLDKMYGSFGESYPPRILSWLTGHTHSNEGEFSTKDVNEWRKIVPAASVETVNNYPECRQVLASVGYQP